jgi:hypothetical protein
MSSPRVTCCRLGNQLPSDSWKGTAFQNPDHWLLGVPPLPPYFSKVLNLKGVIFKVFTTKGLEAKS